MNAAGVLLSHCLKVQDNHSKLIANLDFCLWNMAWPSWQRQTQNIDVFFFSFFFLKSNYHHFNDAEMPSYNTFSIQKQTFSSRQRYLSTTKGFKRCHFASCWTTDCLSLLNLSKINDGATPRRRLDLFLDSPSFFSWWWNPNCFTKCHAIRNFRINNWFSSMSKNTILKVTFVCQFKILQKSRLYTDTQYRINPPIGKKIWNSQ